MTSLSRPSQISSSRRLLRRNVSQSIKPNEWMKNGYCCLMTTFSFICIQSHFKKKARLNIQTSNVFAPRRIGLLDRTHRNMQSRLNVHAAPKDAERSVYAVSENMVRKSPRFRSEKIYANLFNSSGPLFTKVRFSTLKMRWHFAK